VSDRYFPVYDESAIRQGLNAGVNAELNKLTILGGVDSTNLVLSRLPEEELHAHVVLADYQNSGKGRRGRAWHSPPGSNIYFSLGWAFQCPIANLAQLPLAIAVCAARTVKSVGVESPGIKWPNDLQVEGRKLGGILVDLRTTGAGQAIAIIGIGLNVRMQENEQSETAISQLWTDVSTHLNQPAPETLRDQLSSRLIEEVFNGLGQYVEKGFGAFESDWLKLDVLQNQEIEISSAESKVSGKAVGISRNGGLMVVCPDASGDPTVKEFFAGDVSVRPLG
jgi:BirA family biotin operon repressor/biotin-[acetyl-CoA-carboxylase] ligase